MQRRWLTSEDDERVVRPESDGDRLPFYRLEARSKPHTAGVEMAWLSQAVFGRAQRREEVNLRQCCRVPVAGGDDCPEATGTRPGDVDGDDGFADEVVRQRRRAASEELVGSKLVIAVSTLPPHGWPEAYAFGASTSTCEARAI